MMMQDKNFYTKQTEALKLALEALDELKYSTSSHAADDIYYEALAAIREALAEQPAQQQKPKFVRNVDGVPCITLVEHEHLMRSRPHSASKPWQGLTDEEKRQIFEREDYQGWLDYINAIEAKLREKNA